MNSNDSFQVGSSIFILPELKYAVDVRHVIAYVNSVQSILSLGYNPASNRVFVRNLHTETSTFKCVLLGFVETTIIPLNTVISADTTNFLNLRNVIRVKCSLVRTFISGTDGVIRPDNTIAVIDNGSDENLIWESNGTSQWIDFPPQCLSVFTVILEDGRGVFLDPLENVEFVFAIEFF